MNQMVTVIIDGVGYEFPAGENLVDAAKRIGNDIPVFCYHPKMGPVGMCRMCLVETGTVVKNRDTGAVETDADGHPQVRWTPKLQTACTMVVSDGMTVRTDTALVAQARQDVLEFLLTSHPLDCPICDKGGECPLQNLTMEHGPGASRMYFEDKINLDKHYPLGELIYLDRERCIQCARCTRFQAELVGDDVLAFHERGRRLQIITHSDPGFDSYFSGNTTDICPVGALTTADFRFGARPWELTSVPSLSPHDPFGANTTLSTRLDRDFGGKAVVKRVMPRQNEYVNEIWIDDRTRFGHHFSRGSNRLLAPLVRNSAGRRMPQSWPAALDAVAQLMQAADGDVAVIAGSGASNEDLFALRQLVQGVGGARFGAWPPTHAGAALNAQFGVGVGTNLKDMGTGDAILVVAADLEEEAPLARLRVKQAADRGAAVFVLNARTTRLAELVRRRHRLTYGPGQPVQALANFAGQYPEAYDTLASAANLVLITGADGLDAPGSRALAEAAASLLVSTGHVGRANNGLVALVPGPNGQGLFDMGYTVEATADIIANPPQLLILAQADVTEDDPDAATWLGQAGHVVQFALFSDETGPFTAVALPIASFAERDGTFTSLERRVQRFYTAQGPLGEALALWSAVSRLGERLGQGRPRQSAAAVMLEITRAVPGYETCRYRDLAHVEQQYPIVGREDVYYGGTAYDNRGGLGVQVSTLAERDGAPPLPELALPQTATPVTDSADGSLLLWPTTELYNRQRVFQPSAAALMEPRIPAPYVELHPDDAAALGLLHGDSATVHYETATGSHTLTVTTRVSNAAPQGCALLPRHLDPAHVAPMTPTVGTLRKAAVLLAAGD